VHRLGLIRLARAGLGSTILLVGLAACSDDTGTESRENRTPVVLPATGSCGAAVTDPLDPASGRHVLPGAPEPVYKLNPPTSGAHQPGLVTAGVLDAPLSRAVQVGALEAGLVIVHWNGLTETELAALRTVATGDQVVVMPDPSIGADRVVVTSWVHRMTCSKPDPAAIGAFVSQLAGHGPGHPE
jgi:hypothetical protein